MSDAPELLPTARLVIEWDDDINPEDPQAFNDHANQLILAVAADLIVQGKRPWFEVWYPQTTADDFDAVEVDPTTGDVTTLPPYTELEGANA